MGMFDGLLGGIVGAGMVSVVPLTIIGGIFIIAAYLPIHGWDKLIAPYLQLLQVPVTATFGMLSIFVCFAIGYDLGKQLKQEAIVSATIAIPWCKSAIPIGTA